jgi:hypothetical protein
MTKEFCNEVLTPEQIATLEGKGCDFEILWDCIQRAGTRVVDLLKSVGVLLLLLWLAASATAQEKKKFATGRVRPANLPALKMADFAKHGHIQLPKVVAPTWDCRSLGIVGPIKDQGACGSCYAFSGNDVAEGALYKAGVLKSDQPLSVQYVLDCGRNGGCNGDDNTTI